MDELIGGGIILRVFGDICPDRGYSRIFRESDVSSVFGFSAELISSADIAIANLECPLTERLTPITKVGPCLAGPIRTASVLAQSGFTAVNLANNHIMDHGLPGLRSTLRACEEAGLETVGAGESAEAAERPLVLVRKGIRVGIYSMAETEFSIASESHGGANGIDASRWFMEVHSLRLQSDFVLVLLHAGKENYPLPSPRTQLLCREIIDGGACMVVCQHSHCIGACEEYNGGTIVYGQGNYIFDDVGRVPESWHTGMIAEVAIRDGKSYSFAPLYFHQSIAAECVKRLSGQALETAAARQAELNALVADRASVEREWRILVKQDVPRLLYSLSGYSGIMIKILHRLGFHKLLYRRQARMTALNLLRCQTHREMLETYLKDE